MKKLCLLLTMLAMMVVTGVRAEDKIITLSFANDTDNGITWNANDCTTSGNAITFTNGNSNKPYWTFTNAVDFKALAFVITERTAETTFEFVDENNKVAYAHSFGTDAVKIIQGSSDLTNDQGADLTKIKQINIDPRTSEKDKSITFTSITLVVGQSTTSYDVLSSTSFVKTGLNLSDGLVEILDYATNNDGTHASSVSGTTIKAVGNDKVVDGVAKKYVNYQAGLKDLSYSVSDYDYLVASITTTSSSFNFILKQDGQSDVTYNISSSAQPSVLIKLSDLSINTINQIAIGTIAEGTLTVNDIYFYKSGTGYEITRQNTAANAYGTICLPYAASVPSNASVFHYRQEPGRHKAIYRRCEELGGWQGLYFQEH